MNAKGLTPILNVSNIQASFVWFTQLGWSKAWEWGEPTSFGGVCSGDYEIFLCQDGQGGRGKGGQRQTFGPGNEIADQGCWMSIWVDDVDAVYKHCLSQGLDITWEPEEMPWRVREMHVRHPDGHVFRISQELDND